MNSVQPLLDPVLWGRWILALVLVVGVPGYLLWGRWQANVDRLSRLVLSLAAGLFLVPPLGFVFHLVGLPFRPLVYLPVALLLAWGLGRSVGYRQYAGSCVTNITPLGYRAQILLSVFCLAILVLLLFGLGELSAPPTAHDATNHAFLVDRISSEQSLDIEDIWQSVTGRPNRLYYTGWHGAAALTASTGGVASYISSWYLPLLFMSLLPAALSLLWRAVRVPKPLMLLGALFVITSNYVPASLVGWGGYGQLLGMFLVPAGVLGLLGALHARQWQGGVALGLILFAMLQIHASEIVVVPLLGGLAWWAHGGGRPRLATVLIALGVLGLLAGPVAWKLAVNYLEHNQAVYHPETVSLALACEQFMDVGGRGSWVRQLVVVGLLVGGWVRRLRPLVILSVAWAVLFVALSVFRDPVSNLLATAFYRHAPRILYLQLYVIPPLMAAPFVVAFRLLSRRGWRRLAWGLTAVLLVVSVFEAPRIVVKSYHRNHKSVCFSADAYHCARRIATVWLAGTGS